jgi:sec-independent protein translocase protein TatA
MPFNIGPLELGVVLVIALIIFGPKRVPKVARSFGKGISEFRSTLTLDGGEKAGEASETKDAARPAATQTGSSITK